MTLEASIRDALLAMNAVTAIVGTGNSARIRVDRLHVGDEFPCILIDVETEEKVNDLSGKGGASFSSVTVTCNDGTREGARALAEAVRVNGTNPGTGLAGYSGASFDCTVESIATGFVANEDGSDEGWYQCVMACEVFATEAV